MNVKVPTVDRPFTVTTTLPVVAPLGTGTMICDAPQFVGVPDTPLKVTVLVLCVEPKFVPVIVTEVPTPPEVGEIPVMLGPPLTVNVTPLLATPLTVTITVPVVAALGTVATMLVLLQLVVTATLPLNATELVPCDDPKFVPVMVTDAPRDPEVGDKLVMLGGVRIGNDTALLATPFTVTTRLPLVAPAGTGTTI